MTLLSWLLVLAAAFVAAAINSIAGGGTFLSFPTLTGVARLSEKVANMTSTIGLWPGSASSDRSGAEGVRRIRAGMLIGYGIISLIGGATGRCCSLQDEPARPSSCVIPWLLAFATVVFAFSKPIARWAGRQHGDRSLKWTLFVGGDAARRRDLRRLFGAGIGVLMLAGLRSRGWTTSTR